MAPETLIILKYTCPHCGHVTRVEHPELNKGTARSIAGTGLFGHYCGYCTRYTMSPDCVEVKI